ncbi:unnamed protein product [Symbiodinium natans]|uniref:Uncharacterized protein n=1 Tax=Symbiodinium natans TaxID=878477 RepID=A0A812RRM0_9DINO|nr:unnamed protein product [Symbiodinium natans]
MFRQKRCGSHSPAASGWPSKAENLRRRPCNLKALSLNHPMPHASIPGPRLRRHLAFVGDVNVAGSSRPLQNRDPLPPHRRQVERPKVGHQAVQAEDSTAQDALERVKQLEAASAAEAGQLQAWRDMAAAKALGKLNVTIVCPRAECNVNGVKVEMDSWRSEQLRRDFEDKASWIRKLQACEFASWKVLPRFVQLIVSDVSSRFTDKFTGLPLCRKKVEANNAAGEPTGLARQGFSQFFTDTDGLKICQGRKYIPVSTGENHQWRPSKRQLSEPGLHNIEKNEGKLRVDPPPTKVFSIPERRHVRLVESKEEYGDLSVGKGIVLRAPGVRAAEVAAREVDVTVEMQRKARNHELDVKRNGIGVMGCASSTTVVHDDMEEIRVTFEDRRGRLITEHNKQFKEPIRRFNSFRCSDKDAGGITAPIASTHTHHVNQLNKFLAAIDKNPELLEKRVHPSQRAEHPSLDILKADKGTSSWHSLATVSTASEASNIPGSFA